MSDYYTESQMQRIEQAAYDGAMLEAGKAWERQRYEFGATEAELAERIAELEDALNARIAQLEKEIARRDEIITRLKEDAERLAATYVVEVFPHEWVCRGGCHHWARFGEQIDHAPDCPITLHRALMKELE